MSKPSTKFVCQSCGAEFPKWQGQCDECGKWNTLVETKVENVVKSRAKVGTGETVKIFRLSEIKSKTFSRVKTGIGELDRVLGGGIVPGSLVLVAGEPGIGKSTLLTQLALNLINNSAAVDTNFSDSLTTNLTRFANRARKSSSPSSGLSRDTVHPPQFAKQFGRVNTQTLSNLSPALPKKSQSPRESTLFSAKQSSLNTKYQIPNTVLYVCGEESPEQIKLRIQRLQQWNNETMKQWNNLLFLPETNMENILSGIRDKGLGISLIIVDSIQTMWTANLTGTAGSVGQVRECSNMLLSFAKKTNIPVFLVGHITKEGAIAGPKVLEHLVDTVLYLEGDRQHEFRILRTSKNRFGPTDEVGVFTMTDKGMEEVKDPARIFLEVRSEKLEVSVGSAITVTMQGIRPILVEIQALVVPTNLAMPRRVASGINYQKLQVLCAVIQKQLGLPLYQSDVFVNVAGGLKLSEPAVDLAVAMAIISSFRNKPLPSKAVVLGELGLLGETRRVGFWDKRINEARKLGFSKIIGEREINLRQVAGYLK